MSSIATLGLRDYAARYGLLLEEAYALMEHLRKSTPELPLHALPDLPPTLEGLAVYVGVSRGLEICGLQLWQLEEAFLRGTLTAYRRVTLGNGTRAYKPHTDGRLIELFLELSELRRFARSLLEQGPPLLISPLTPKIVRSVGSRLLRQTLGVTLERLQTLTLYLEKVSPEGLPTSPAQALLFTLYQSRFPTDPEQLVKGTDVPAPLAQVAIAATLSALLHAPPEVIDMLPRAWKSKLPGKERPQVSVLEKALIEYYGSVAQAETALDLSLERIYKLYSHAYSHLQDPLLASKVIATLELWQIEHQMYRSISRRFNLPIDALKKAEHKLEEVLIRKGRFHLPYTPTLLEPDS